MSYRFWVWTMLGATAACVVVDTLLLDGLELFAGVGAGSWFSMAGR